jgi:hypothetical protein
MVALPRRAETRPSSKIALNSLFGARDWAQLGFCKVSFSGRGKRAFPVIPFFANRVDYLKFHIWQAVSGIKIIINRY